jgi:hypothetical protein
MYLCIENCIELMMSFVPPRTTEQDLAGRVHDLHKTKQDREAAEKLSNKVSHVTESLENVQRGTERRRSNHSSR